VSVETLYSARWSGPTLIEQGETQDVSLAIERSGSATSLTSGTFTLYSPAGEALISAQTATISGGTVSYEIGATDLDDEALGPRWLVKFAVVISGDTHTFYNDAVLCLSRIYPPVGHTDIVGRHGDIANLLPSGTTSTQAYLDEAWSMLTNRMYSESVPFWKLRTPSALRSALLYGALAIIFRDFSTLLDPGDRYDALADRYDADYEREFKALRARFDSSEDNVLTGSQTPTAPVLMLSSGPRRGYRYK